MYIYVLNNIHSYATRSNEILAKKGHYQCLYKRQKKMFCFAKLFCSCWDLIFIHTTCFLYICLYAYSSVYLFLYSWMVNKKILCVSFWYEYFIRWNLCKHNCCASSSNHFRFNAFSLGNNRRKTCPYCHLSKSYMLLRAFRQSL